MTPQQAESIYDVLVNLCGAREEERSDFVHCHVGRRCTEWRFQGSLGFGGKFRRDDLLGRWYVDCYQEDETPELKRIVERTNAALSDLFVLHG